MTNTFKPVALAAAVAAATLAVGTGAASAQAEVTLRCQHFLSPMGSVPRFFIVPWAEKIEADSGGRIDVEIYPAMQLGGAPPALYDQIRDGVIDCGWTIPAYTPGRFPEAEAFELPFMTSMSAEASSRAAWDYTQEHLQERFNDIHLIAVHVHGPGVIHTTNAPIESIADFDGLQLRGPSRMANALLEELGATPVGMPVPAFPEALSRGTVDGGVIPWEVVPALRVEELAQNHTQIGGDRALYNTFFIWGMNPDTYNSLPEDLRAVIDANSGVETSAWAGRAMDEGDDLAETAIRERGNTIVTLSDDVVAELRAVGEEVTQRWIEEMNGLGLDGQQLVDDARALVAQYSDN
ncbi:TRAP transporter substrate-binding protein [Roseibacterium sp. SDUM158016]|uniref:TRAP transporter substrate-binding protein n=1 Tax=Roseicyclus sediminis TaxID=2980997 RepID=UPI0021D214EF|nr:TRAP transporter substrate-binding protein [Roseibacterium sp. SDUM158016]MCU4654220.1 TRAP transporter substrate-binding protein [Roseibacterium sp. SDUM158016]